MAWKPLFWRVATHKSSQSGAWPLLSGVRYGTKAYKMALTALFGRGKCVVLVHAKVNQQHGDICRADAADA